MNKKDDFYRIFTILLVLGAFAISLFLPTAGMAGGMGAKPTITVTPDITGSKKVNFIIAGSGFEPNQELQLELYMDGVSSLIHHSVKPKMVPNELGAFAGVWTASREFKKKLLKPLPMVYTLTVLDKDFNILATAPLLFCDPKTKEKFPACMFLK